MEEIDINITATPITGKMLYDQYNRYIGSIPGTSYLDKLEASYFEYTNDLLTKNIRYSEESSEKNLEKDLNIIFGEK